MDEELDFVQPHKKISVNLDFRTQKEELPMIHNILFVSRNKDNKYTEGFKERRVSFISEKDPDDLMDDFLSFVKKGVPEEICRFYRSVNARDPEKINKNLLHYIIDHPDFNPCNSESKIASIAAKKECAAESKWMFDFDNSSIDDLLEFEQDIRAIVKDDPQFEIHTSPNGYHVITPKHFDTRELLKKWTDVELKRDALYLHHLACNWV